MQIFRRFLNFLYNACGVLAALSIAAIAAIVIAQIVGRFFDILIPSADDFAGYALEASTFLGLAYTFRANGHIRVTLFTKQLSERWGRWAEIYALLLGSLAVGYFAWYAFDMVWTSYDFGDVSAGLVAVPLWIPQSAIFVGLFLMTVTMVDELIRALLGHTPVYVGQEKDIFGDD